MPRCLVLHDSKLGLLPARAFSSTPAIWLTLKYYQVYRLDDLIGYSSEVREYLDGLTLTTHYLAFQRPTESLCMPLRDRKSLDLSTVITYAWQPREDSYKRHHRRVVAILPGLPKTQRSAPSKVAECQRTSSTQTPPGTCDPPARPPDTPCESPPPPPCSA
jgi:hypothetical protein